MVKVPTHCSRCYYTGWPRREVLEKVLGGQKIPPLACRDSTGVGAGWREVCVESEKLIHCIP